MLKGAEGDSGSLYLFCLFNESHADIEPYTDLFRSCSVRINQCAVNASSIAQTGHKSQRIVLSDLYFFLSSIAVSHNVCMN